MYDIIEKVGFIASVGLPLWNIPLMLKIIQRKSSEDISLHWVFGVWGCILLMAPSGLRSELLVWKAFNVMNLILFTGVVIVTMKYRKKKS